MNRQNGWRFPLLVVLSVILALGGGTSAVAGHHEGEQATASEVKKEAMETYEALKSYTLAQRDEAMAAAEKKIAELDARITEMQDAMDEQWQEMNQATREKTRDALKTLRKQREDLAEWYGGMRYSSKEAWEDVKKGFADSYDRLEKAFEKARQDFEKNNP